MTQAPKWFVPVAIAALLWNLLGCAAYLADVRMGPEDVARLDAAQQALYAARPAWSVGATAIAVWGGALGCLGLALRRGWALPVLVASLLGVIVQDVSLFVVGQAARLAGPTAIVLQAIVLLVSIGLVGLARTARQRGWLRRGLAPPGAGSAGGKRRWQAWSCRAATRRSRRAAGDATVARARGA